MITYRPRQSLPRSPSGSQRPTRYKSSFPAQSTLQNRDNNRSLKKK